MEKFPESSSKGTKRRRDEDSDAGNTSSLEDDLTFTDTSVALRIMRAQFPHIQKGSVEPFILKSQLYSSVKDRTQVDRELESLRRDKVLRLFKLNTGQDDHAVMFLDDYLNQIDRVVKRMEGKKVEEYEVFGWLKTHVLDSKLETGIEHQELCSLLSLGGKVKDSHISVLINAGVLDGLVTKPSQSHMVVMVEQQHWLSQWAPIETHERLDAPCYPRKYQSISHFSNLLNNFIWTILSRTKFLVSSLGQLLQFVWLYLQIHNIPNLILHSFSIFFSMLLHPILGLHQEEVYDQPLVFLLLVILVLFVNFIGLSLV
ncbi:uncharacterized protein LOC108326007 isoform X4 [Vigna angularis]|uniref:uncharacterized protein LOC108326007 isoform X4 n=1 Tax=Phaseolus angularis TaxID=3914 RepID=UPI000809E01C|nr:uncharacterized protein LOC108326007 isoform X4 [Vigna angularis]